MPFQPKFKGPLTQTNSDRTCHKVDKPLRRWNYQIELHNGSYILNPYEKALFHVVTWTCVIGIGLYGYVFTKGFVDGLYAADQCDA